MILRTNLHAGQLDLNPDDQSYLRILRDQATTQFKATDQATSQQAINLASILKQTNASGSVSPRSLY